MDKIHKIKNVLAWVFGLLALAIFTTMDDSKSGTAWLFMVASGAWIPLAGAMSIPGEIKPEDFKHISIHFVLFYFLGIFTMMIWMKYF